MHLVVFDVDGTLVESGEFDGILYARAVREALDIEVDDDWSGYRHQTDSGILEEILDRHGIEGDHSVTHALVRKTFAALVRDYLVRRSGRLPEIPGAAAFVNRLVAHPGVSVGVATGGWRETAAMKLRAIGLDPETLHLASGSDATHRTEIMRIAERRALAGGSGGRKFYFGNQPWDREASLNLGWNFVGIGNRVRHHTRFRDYRDDESIEVVLGLRSPVA